MSDYARPDSLVSTQWVQEHLDDPTVRVVEVDVNIESYDEAHLPGAVGWNWSTQLCDPVRRDVVPKDALETLLSNSGIANDTTVILYGDNNNWFAAWALWQLEMYGHRDVRIMNGGRNLWLAQGRPLSFDTPEWPATDYVAKEANPAVRSYLRQVEEAVSHDTHHMIDVRSPDEFTGALLAPPGLPETCQRGGHIPGAANVPWGAVCNADGTFKSRDDLEALYKAQGVDGSRPVIAYCRIGERSSHTWFALSHLLGYESTNYDGSWTEWGNLVGARIETGPRKQG